MTQQTAQGFASLLPLRFKSRARSVDIPDRQVVPSHVPGLNFSAEVLNLEADQFVVLNQRNHRSCAPVTDHVEIDGKIPAPLPGEGRVLLLTRTEGDPNGASCRRHLSNLQGMGQAGLQGALLPLGCSPPLSSALALRNSSLLSAGHSREVI